MPSFLFACSSQIFFFRREEKNIKNTEERKSFPDETAEQGTPWQIFTQ